MPFDLTFSFPLPNGLHARPASCIEETISPFASEVLLVNHRNGRQADARSVLSLVGLDCKPEDDCSFRVAGADEQDAFAALKTFLYEKFPWCDDALPVSSTPAGEVRLPPSLRAEEFRFVCAVPVVPGIGQGNVVRIGQGDFFGEIPPFPALEPAREIERLDRSLHALREKLENRLAVLDAGVEKQILAAHRSVVRDPELKAKLIELVGTDSCSSAEAIIGAARYFADVLQATHNPLLQERILDVQDICQQLLEEIYGKAASAPKTVLQCDSICAADNLTPSQFLGLDRRHLRGLVLGHSGATSHAVILARSFAIPILAGLDHAAADLRNGQKVILDANLGILVIEPTPRVERYYQQELRSQSNRRQFLERSFREEPRTVDGRRIGVAINLSTACELETPLLDGTDGVGLFRTEMLFLDRETPPDEEEQTALYESILKQAGGRPVTIRTLDVGGDKALPYLNLPAEANPFLGYRAVRMYPAFEEILAAQFRALLRASACGPLRILIPMVSCIDEIVWVKSLLAKARTQCTDKGLQVGESVSLGIMIEVPSVAFQIDHFSREVDYFSIGTNDLAQYFMAADRENKKVSHLFDPLQPSFLRFLKTIVDSVHVQGKRVGMCGEMAGSLEALPLLVGLGLDELSMAIPRLVEMKHTLRQLCASACHDLTRQALDCLSAGEVRELLNRSTEWQAELPLITGDLICVEADCESREEAIKEVVGKLYGTGRTADPASVEEDVWQREAVYSTGLGHGFAIPHCKSRAVSANSIGLLKLRQPVAWNSNDGKPVDMVILLAVRDGDKDNTHMKVFSRLARKIVHEEFRDALRRESDPDRLLQFIKDAIEIK